MDRKDARRRHVRVELQIDQGNEDLRAVVMRSLREPSRSKPKCRIFVTAIRVMEGIEGLELSRFTALWIVRDDPLD